MTHKGSVDPITIVASRVVDLRAELEAQLRAVSRLEEQLRRTTNEGKRGLKEVLRRELTGMIRNNRNILDVLEQLAGDAQLPATNAVIQNPG